MRQNQVTERDRALVRYIHNYQGQNGYSPTLREIRKHFDISSTSVVTFRLHRLSRFGLATFTPRVARSLQLTTIGLKAIGVKNNPGVRFEAHVVPQQGGMLSLVGDDLPSDFDHKKRYRVTIHEVK